MTPTLRTGLGILISVFVVPGFPSRAAKWFTNDGGGYLGTDRLTVLAGAGDEPSRQP